MYSCPNCEFQVQDFVLACPSCELDLTAMAKMNEFPDRLFNEALVAAKQEDWVTASMKCNAALLQRSRDAGLWMLLGTVYARMHAFQLARQCFQTVLMFDRSYAPAQRGIQVLDQLLGPARQQISS